MSRSIIVMMIVGLFVLAGCAASDAPAEPVKGPGEEVGPPPEEAEAPAEAGLPAVGEAGAADEQEIAQEPGCEVGTEGCPATANDRWMPVIEAFGGAEMALVPEGCFMMGDGRANRAPSHEQCLAAPYWIDVTEVTNEQFALFINEVGNQMEGGVTWLDVAAENSHLAESDGAWRVESGFEDHPAVEVSWFGAAAFCDWRGVRLLTEPEWEYAARGPDGLAFPWGSEFVEENAITKDNSDGAPAPVGSRPGGASWVGALDLTGNVWEWTVAVFEPYPYDGTDGREVDAQGDNTSARVLRGGAYNAGGLQSPAVIRLRLTPDTTQPFIGFRCARDA